MYLPLVLALLVTGAAHAAPLGPGDHTRVVTIGQQRRTYLIHIPERHDPKKAAPVVLALHGVLMNGNLMVKFSGLNATSEREGFIVVYPHGTGLGRFLTWNAGGVRGGKAGRKADDVGYISRLLDDLGTVATVDPRRVYACGLSNGGMMCYRLAAELSGRIAAIAPVAGAIAIEKCEPTRPVPVIHFHGTRDPYVPFAAHRSGIGSFMRHKSVEDSIMTWVKLDRCNPKPRIDMLSKDGDDLKVTRKTYRGRGKGAEVVLIVIEGGGHTWPGMRTPLPFLGKSALNISANDLMWEFFRKHKLK